LAGSAPEKPDALPDYAGTVIFYKVDGRLTELLVLNVAKCRDAILSEKAAAIVSAERLAASLKFRLETDRLLSLGGDLLARSAARHGLGLKNDDIRFSKNAFGKPFLNGFKNFHFNVSHSGALAICAISSFEVGCDCEFIDAENKFEGIRSVFSKSELSSIDALSGIDRTMKCYEICTVKECFIKCTGYGLSEDISKLETYREKSIYKIRKSGTELNYFIKPYEHIEGYAVAACSATDDFAGAVSWADEKYLFHAT